MHNKKIKNDYFLIKYLTGKWTTQKQIFLFSNKIISENKNSDYFSTNKKFIFSDASHCNLSMITKCYQCESKKYIKKIYLEYRDRENNKKIFFQLRNITRNLSKVTKYSLDSSEKQYEYFYMVNVNIIIVITIIQNLKNKYLGIKISSFIRLK